MKRPAFYTHIATLVTIVVFLIGSLSTSSYVSNPPVTDVGTYIVQATTADEAATLVEHAGGNVSRKLVIIKGVVATLDTRAVNRLRATAGVSLHRDQQVMSTDVGSADTKETGTSGYTLYPAAAVQVDSLHRQTVPTYENTCNNGWIDPSDTTATKPLTGWGVTVAIVDSGLLRMASSGDWKWRWGNLLMSDNSGRCLIYQDFLSHYITNSKDTYGHGTHVVSTIGDNRETQLSSNSTATPVGVAPDVNLIVARALGNDGSGSYSDVIAAIDWIVMTKDIYNTKVLNLSIYAPVEGPYWTDPLNQAVMRAWEAGITVVAAAGNNGSDAGTITVPGNVPYVITVGAMKSGRYTTSGYDELATYSSRGPTESAFVKPDVVVPASRTIAAMPCSSYLAITSGTTGCSGERMNLDIGAQSSAQKYYELSGTSMAAAQVSGIVALMLQANPYLTNDEVKYRLLATARPAVDQVTGQLRYSVWEQGAGLVDANAAVLETISGSANEGMEIDIDLDPLSEYHYWGNSTWDSMSGTFSLVDPTNGSALQVWASDRNAWSGSAWIWSGGRNAWSGGRNAWSGGRNAWSGATAIATSLLWAGSIRPWLQNAGLQDVGEMAGGIVQEVVPMQQRVIYIPSVIR